MTHTITHAALAAAYIAITAGVFVAGIAIGFLAGLLF